MEYFILEDMLPSGFEVVKDIQNYEIEGENNYSPYYDNYGWGRRPWIWNYADKEYRDEKVAFFVTYVSEKMEFSYIMKAQIPGEYSVMPAQGYLMYYPELAGNTKRCKDCSKRFIDSYFFLLLRPLRERKGVHAGSAKLFTQSSQSNNYLCTSSY
jgi:uncharacterized protein YfaS (alpha-2-macroglobulin family)